MDLRVTALEGLVNAYGFPLLPSFVSPYEGGFCMRPKEGTKGPF